MNFADYVEHSPMLVEFLTRMNRRYDLALATSNTGEFVHKVLRLMGIEPFFKFISSSDDHASKRDAYAAFIQELKIYPAQVVCIGDNRERDLQPATLLGISCIHIEDERSVFTVEKRIKEHTFDKFKS